MASEISLTYRSKGIITTDSRRVLQRNVKRKAAWPADTLTGLPSQLTIERGHAIMPLPKPGVLSPPDMVWPAQNLAQVICLLDQALGMAKADQRG